MPSIMSQIRSAQGGATSIPDEQNAVLKYFSDLAAKAPMAAPRVVPGKPKKQRLSIMARIQEMIANAPMAAPRHREERNANRR